MKDSQHIVIEPEWGGDPEVFKASSKRVPL
jgi:hypothetical protein